MLGALRSLSLRHCLGNTMPILGQLAGTILSSLISFWRRTIHPKIVIETNGQWQIFICHTSIFQKITNTFYFQYCTFFKCINFNIYLGCDMWLLWGVGMSRPPLFDLARVHVRATGRSVHWVWAQRVGPWRAHLQVLLLLLFPLWGRPVRAPSILSGAWVRELQVWVEFSFIPNIRQRKDFLTGNMLKFVRSFNYKHFLFW